mmetsp:Transcript_48591/g.141520  ORF Transcript_48591/g.141520 Transcript_48591/m.141520 type:complete len:268 (-) Transcript_48591:463-1266(-)
MGDAHELQDEAHHVEIAPRDGQVEQRDPHVRARPLVRRLVRHCGRAAADERLSGEVGHLQAHQGIRAVGRQRADHIRPGADHGQGQRHPLRAVHAAVHGVHHGAGPHAEELPDEGVVTAEDGEHQRRPMVSGRRGVRVLAALQEELHHVQVPPPRREVYRQQTLVEALHSDALEARLRAGDLGAAPENAGGEAVHLGRAHIELAGAGVDMRPSLERADGRADATPRASGVEGRPTVVAQAAARGVDMDGRPRLQRPGEDVHALIDQA